MDENINSIDQFIQGHLAKYKEKIAFRNCEDGGRVSFSQFIDDIKQVSDGFCKAGYSGETIILAAENSYSWIVLAMGVLASGNCLVPVDAELSDETLKEQARFVESSLCVISQSFESTFEGGFKSVRIHDAVKGEEHLPRCDRKSPKGENKAAMIVFTSRTMGTQKAVMLSEKNIIAVIRGGNGYVVSEGETFSMLPLCHTYAFICGVLGPIGGGETVILNDKLRNFAKNLKSMSPAMMFTVPMVLEKMRGLVYQGLKDTGKEKAFGRWLKISGFLMKIGIDVRRKIFKEIIAGFGGRLAVIVSGGAPIQNDIIDFFHWIGIRVLNGYGITECGPLVSVSSNIYKERQKSDSVGRPIYGCQVKIDSESETDIGEILVKGDNVMMGYYKAGEATDQVLVDGWLRTGDIGRLDHQGLLYVKGRKKNMILADNGKNVYPEEIEGMIKRMTGIEDVIVYQGDGSEIVAEVYVDSLDLDQDRVVERVLVVNDTLPMFAQIARVAVRKEAFEKTTTQKIKRR
ncbi:MAG: AMP-binding protein [Anaerovoracaceae bacterium]|jgi:long-chain acyl-CoA synthetase